MGSLTRDLRSLFQQSHGAKSRPGSRPRRARLTLEQLEDRIVQSSFSTLSLDSTLSTAPITAINSSTAVVAVSPTTQTDASAFASIQQVDPTIDYGDFIPPDPTLNLQPTNPSALSGPGLNILDHPVSTGQTGIGQGQAAIDNRAAQLGLGKAVSKAVFLADGTAAQDFAGGKSLVWSPDTGNEAHLVSGFIRDKYAAEGGIAWGAPMHDDVLFYAGEGSQGINLRAVNDFHLRGGGIASIVWSARTAYAGPRVVMGGAIWSEWVAQGATNNYVPLDDAYNLPDGGRAQDFVSGSDVAFTGEPIGDRYNTIVWSPMTGSHAYNLDYDGIRFKWQSISNYMGSQWFPSSDAAFMLVPQGHFVVSQNFTYAGGSGTIVMGNPVGNVFGVWEVHGDIWKKWQDMGGISKLIPVTDEIWLDGGKVRYSDFVAPNSTRIVRIEWHEGGDIIVRNNLGTYDQVEDGPTGTTSTGLTTTAATYESDPYAFGNDFGSLQIPEYTTAPNSISTDSIWSNPELWSGSPAWDYADYTDFEGLAADFDFSFIVGMPIDPAADVSPAAETAPKAAQTIAFDAIADGNYGDAPIVLNATTDSGLAVSYQVISGPATLTDNLLTITGAGVVTVEATQAGDDNFEAATPIDLSFTVNKQAQAITADPIADATYGDGPIVLNATSSSGLPVSYQILSGPATLTDNVLMITGAGVVTVEATQAGDDNFEAATPIDLSFTVNKAHLSVTADNQTRVFGQANPTFTAAITGFVNGETLDNSGVSGDADFSTMATDLSPVGTYAITASLGSMTADNYDFTNFIDGSLTVAKAGTTVGLNSSALSATVGQQVTLTATVAAYNSSAIPVGTVTFKDGSTILGTGTLSNGVATLTTAKLAAGSHALTAVYAGNGNFTTSASAVLSQKVLQASKTTVQSSVASSTFGQAITLTATVAPAAGAVIPTGMVTFKDGATILGTAALSSGKATLTTALLGAGSHAITVVYAGSTTFAGSTSASVTLTVNKAAISLTLTSSASTATFGQTVTFTIKAPAGTVPTGTITIKDGTTVLGTATFVNGVAVFTTSKLSKGKHNLTAVYAGNANFLASTSAALVQTIS